MTCGATSAHKRPVPFGVKISEELLGDAAPVLSQGGIVAGIEDAARTGYDAAELHVRDPRSLDVAAIRSAARAAGVTVSAIGTGLEYTKNGLSMTSDDPAIRERMNDRFREHIELAADFAATAGVTLVLEPVAYYFSSLLNTTAESLEFLRRPGLESVELLLDTHHMLLEDPDIPATFRLAADRLAYVHASDSNRRSPGSGNIDFSAVARALAEIGYTGTVSVEVLPFPDGPRAAVESISEFGRVFAS